MIIKVKKVFLINIIKYKTAIQIKKKDILSRFRVKKACMSKIDFFNQIFESLLTFFEHYF